MKWSIEYRMSRNTTAKVMRVRIMANPSEVHCDPTMSSLTSIAVAATPVKSSRFAVPPLEGAGHLVDHINALAVSATG